MFYFLFALLDLDMSSILIGSFDGQTSTSARKKRMRSSTKFEGKRVWRATEFARKFKFPMHGMASSP